MGDLPSFQDKEVENVDESAWVPYGTEVVPAAAFLNGYAHTEGKRFVSSDVPLIDKLLEKNQIEEEHHAIALRIVRLFRSGTAKYGYSTMKIFSSPSGYDNSSYCPMTLFIRATRELKTCQLYWIRVVCGIRECSYLNASANADLIKDALEAVDKCLRDIPYVAVEEEE